MLFWDCLESEFRMPRFAKTTSRKSTCEFDNLNLEQNNPKKKILTSSMAPDSQKYTKMELELFQKNPAKSQKNKNKKKVCVRIGWLGWLFFNLFGSKKAVIAGFFQTDLRKFGKLQN